ncbi:MAG: rRNA methyltransferase, partial [Halomonas sp.]|nr:rRNA methyltransferase [Halomonas sp.]
MDVDGVTQAARGQGIVAAGAGLRALAERLGMAWVPAPPEGGLAMIETPRGLAIAGDAETYGNPLRVD